MSLAPVVKYLQALLVSVSNNTCVGLADAVEGISYDALNRLLQGSTPLVQKGGCLILDHTTLQKFTTGPGCIFKRTAKPEASSWGYRGCCCGPMAPSACR